MENGMLSSVQAERIGGYSVISTVQREISIFSAIVRQSVGIIGKVDCDATSRLAYRAIGFNRGLCAGPHIHLIGGKTVNQLEAAIADILATVGKLSVVVPVAEQRKQIGYALANLFLHENEDFDTQAFIDAAELPE